MFNHASQLRFFIVLLLGGLLAACSPANSILPDVSQQEQGDGQTCLSDNFKIFLPSFIESVSVQRASVTVPLKNQVLVDGIHDDPVPVTRLLNIEEITFPVIPSEKEMGENNLKIRLESKGIETTTVLYKEDTGYLIKYIFHKPNGCWKLMSIEDWSM